MAPRALILSIDQGTTSSRALVFDADARLVALAQEEFPQIYPQPGWVEHDPEAIWRTTLATARSAVAKAEAGGDQVVAIGVANQRETAVIWDRRTLAPIANAIVWQDRRTAAECERLRASIGDAAVRSKTGLMLDPYFSATKIAWLLDNVEGARARAGRGDLAFGTIDSFILARLTRGAHATDATNASRTNLYNIAEGRWDEGLLDLFRVPGRCLPEALDTIADFGVADATHFGRPIPILAMIGDQQAAAVGQGCLSPGDVKSTYGTGCFVLAPTAQFVLSTNKLLSTVARRIDGVIHYALEGSIFIAGAAVQWLRDGLGIIANSAETEALAASLSGNGGVYLVPAFAGLGAPHWDAEARGLICGLTRGSGRAELARAALESVAFQTADLIEAMRADGAPCRSIKVDGGMVANNWLMTFLSDVVGAAVDRPKMLESTAFGAALLAGVRAGVYSSIDEAARLRQVDRVFEPTMKNAEREQLRREWRQAVARALTR